MREEINVKLTAHKLFNLNEVTEMKHIAAGELNNREIVEKVCRVVGLTDLRLVESRWVAYSALRKKDVYVTQIYYNLAKENLEDVTVEEIVSAQFLGKIDA